AWRTGRRRVCDVTAAPPRAHAWVFVAGRGNHARPYCIFGQLPQRHLAYPMQQPVLPAYLIARWLLLLVLLAGVYFLSGFLVPALAALIIGLATWPLFQRIVRACGGRTMLAASLALIGVILVLIIPLSFALSYAV